MNETKSCCENEKESCSICLNLIDLTKGNTAQSECCHQYFHTNCLIRAARTNMTCPLCRASMNDDGAEQNSVQQEQRRNGGDVVAAVIRITAIEAAQQQRNEINAIEQDVSTINSYLSRMAFVLALQELGIPNDECERIANFIDRQSGHNYDIRNQMYIEEINLRRTLYYNTNNGLGRQSYIMCACGRIASYGLIHKPDLNHCHMCKTDDEINLRMLYNPDSMDHVNSVNRAPSSNTNSNGCVIS